MNFLKETEQIFVFKDIFYLNQNMPHQVIYVTSLKTCQSSTPTSEPKMYVCCVSGYRNAKPMHINTHIISELHRQHHLGNEIFPPVNKKFPNFIKTKVSYSSPYSQQPATCFSPNQCASSPRTSTLFC